MNKNTEFTLDERIRLLTGVGAWHTFDANGKLPQIMMTDGPHGLRKVTEELASQNNNSCLATCFPTLSAMSASWDRDLLFKMAEGIASEAISEHVAVVLGPGINMKRSPLCGRNFEYLSEDPYLAGELAKMYVKGMQEKGIGTCLKHFSCNNQETHRCTSNSEVDLRAMFEIYLRAFEIVIKESQPTSIMPSYNLVNGLHSTENHELLTEILRDRFGFLGVAISDWGASTNLTDDILAGLNLEMPDSLGLHKAHIYDALRLGKITEEDIIKASDKMIAFVESRAEALKKAEKAAGLPEIDDPSYNEKKEALRKKLLDKNHLLAKELAENCAVLLKNDGALPLTSDNEKEIIIIGDLADNMRMQGGGSSHINTIKTKNAIESLTDLGFKVKYLKGYSVATDQVDLNLEKEVIAYLDEIKKAGKVPPVLFFAGLTDIYEGEGYDRTTLSLPGNQINLYKQVRARSEKVISVTFGGSPMDIAFLQDSNAILHMYLAGQATLEACAELISGKCTPSGKLAETFPLSINDTPAFATFGKNTDDVEYLESIFIGYRYYDTFNVKTLYPFGYGLSYTTFEYSNLTVTNDRMVSLYVENTGKYAGAETVQIYVKGAKCPTYRENKKLAGFQKIFLKPGERKELHIALSDTAYELFEPSLMKYVTPAGTYEIQACASVCDIRLKETLEIKGSGDVITPHSLTVPFTHDQFAMIYERPFTDLDNPQRGERTSMNSLTMLSRYSLLGKLMIFIGEKIIRSSLPGKSKKDPEVMMMTQGLRECTLDSLTYQGGIPKNIAHAIVLSANKHPFKAFAALFKKN